MTCLFSDAVVNEQFFMLMPSIGLSSFLLGEAYYNNQGNISALVSMPSIGLSSFLPHLFETSYFSRFPGLFLHVFF